MAAYDAMITIECEKSVQMLCDLICAEGSSAIAGALNVLLSHQDADQLKEIYEHLDYNTCEQMSDMCKGFK